MDAILTEGLLNGLVPTVSVFIAAAVVKLVSNVQVQRRALVEQERQHDQERDLTLREVTQLLLGTPATPWTKSVAGLVERVEVLERASDKA